MLTRLCFAAALTALAACAAAASATASGPAFSNTPLISTAPLPAGFSTAPNANSTGNSEPAIAFGSDGTMAVDGLGWLPFQVNLWTGQFGSTPSYFGAMDTDLQNVGRGRTTLGDEDADVEITAAGTLLLADLDLIVNRPFNSFQLGVNVTRCPAGTTSPSGCTHVFLDTAGADREWITSSGSTVWVAYHDAVNSSLIRVMRSTDGGRHWTSVRVFHAQPFTQLANFWPSLAVDPITHAVYTAWTDRHGMYVSSTTDGSLTWSKPPTLVSTVATTVMPWVAARNGKVDVVYYGSTALSTDTANAVWNAYDSQFSGGGWTVKQVSNTPNRVGPICLNGSGCPQNINRELLDLFEVAEDPISGKAAVIYTDTTIDTWTNPNGVTKKLPEIVLAFEN